MGDPELHADEKVLLTTQDVFVKSIPFEAILTNKRIILVDRKKNLIPPKDILLATVRDVESGENAIRDQTITLLLITTTGETRQLVLTFSRTAGGGRKRERDEWVRLLKEQTSSSIQKAIRKVVPSFEEEPKRKVREAAATKIGISSRQPVKKEIEAARPIKKIVEMEKVVDTETVPPRPVETTSLPSGVFCSRCGNRVPVESVFCNRCGSRMTPPEHEIPEKVIPEKVIPEKVIPEKTIPEKVIPEKPIPEKVIPEKVIPEKIIPEEIIPEIVIPEKVVPEKVIPDKETVSAVPQVSVESPIPVKQPVMTSLSAERRERPLDKEIQSIEPLIEGSVPRSTEAPPVPSSKPVETITETPVSPESPPSSPESASIAQAAQSIIDAAGPRQSGTAASPACAAQPVPAVNPASGGEQAGSLPSSFGKDLSQQPAAGGSPFSHPPPSGDTGARRMAILAGAVAVIVIIALAGVIFFYGNYLNGPGTEPVTTTPEVTMTPALSETTSLPTTVRTVETTVATPTPTPDIIPRTGVWVRVIYSQTYKGSVGTAGYQTEVYETGEKFFAISTVTGIVEASIEKKDGTNEELVVEVYKDGELMTRDSTTTPKGVVEVQADLRPPATTTAPKTVATTTVTTTGGVTTAATAS